VPYLLGFHPTDSLVLVGLCDGALVVTARLDLADALGVATVEHTIAAMVRGGSTSLVVAVYGNEVPAAGDDELPWLGLAQLVERTAADAGCEVHDVLLVAGGRWWSLMCGSADCCPREGREIPAAPSSFTAAATFEGVVALPDRKALAALLDPLPDPARDALEASIAAAEHAGVAAVIEGDPCRHERSVKRALFAAARECDAAGWTGPDDETVARFGVALSLPAQRDAVWVAIDGGRLDGRALWRDLARRLPSPYDAGPLFLYGWASWRAGDGALAGIAAERAVSSDPGYSAADLLLAALAHGVDPRRLPKLRLPRSA
jgi:hypothetical protein